MRAETVGKLTRCPLCMNPTSMKPKHIGRTMQALCKSTPSQSSSTMAIIAIEDISAVLHTSNVVKHLLHATPIVPILRGSSRLVSQVCSSQKTWVCNRAMRFMSRCWIVAPDTWRVETGETSMWCCTRQDISPQARYGCEETPRSISPCVLCDLLAWTFSNGDGCCGCWVIPERRLRHSDRLDDA